MKKKFLIFCGQEFYANGGANDLMSVMDNEKKAIQHAKELIGKSFSTNFWGDLEMPIEWVQVFDLEMCEVIVKDGKVHGDDCGIILI